VSEMSHIRLRDKMSLNSASVMAESRLRYCRIISLEWQKSRGIDPCSQVVFGVLLLVAMLI
jgi:hypothetical protein